MARQPDSGGERESATEVVETAAALAIPSLADNRGRIGKARRSASSETGTARLSEPDLGSPPSDLWVRIREGFQLEAPNNTRIERALEWYAEHPEYLQRVAQRARPYLYFIVEQAERRNIPLEIVLLPVVESGFQPLARSPSQASGLWQFIPSTGRAVGLRQTWWYDGRRDIVSSTQAALEYLVTLKDRFGGDWEVALAAYNSGAGTVSRAIKRNLSRGEPTDYWSLPLPQETENYVPRLLALAKLVADPQHYGVRFAAIPDAPYFTGVDIEEQLDLAVAAELAGMDPEELRLLNPGFNRWASDPAGPHELQLPIAVADDFRQRLARLPVQQRMRWQRYRIRPGDSLSGISHRHGVSVAMLRQANRLGGSRIRAGNDLLIPLTGEDRGAGRSAIADSGKKTLYVVQPEDTLWDIGRAHKVSHQQVAKWNGISSAETLRPGLELVIWEANDRPQAKVALDLGAKPNQQTAAGSNFVRYRVRRGDSLYRIARRFNVGIADLKRWNRIPRSLLRPGQKLRIYLDDTAQKVL